MAGTLALMVGIGAAAAVRAAGYRRGSVAT
jgi:hypothetical protein